MPSGVLGARGKWGGRKPLLRTPAGYVPTFVEPEKWYLVVDCSRCLEPTPFAEAPTPEDEPNYTAPQISNLITHPGVTTTGPKRGLTWSPDAPGGC